MSAYDPKDPTSVPEHVRQRARKVHETLIGRLEENSGRDKPLEGLRVGVPAVCLVAHTCRALRRPVN